MTLTLLMRRVVLAGSLDWKNAPGRGEGVGTLKALVRRGLIDAQGLEHGVDFARYRLTAAGVRAKAELRERAAARSAA